MCRVISLTEQRGYRQVEILLRHPIVSDDRQLLKIFRVIEQDEPSHWAPYDEWLRAHGYRKANFWERAIDQAIHSELLFIKLPVLFFSMRLKRLARWPDETDAAPMSPRELNALAA